MTATRVEHTIPAAAAQRAHRAAEGEPISVPQGRLAAARALWVAIALIDVGLFLASIPARWDRLHFISAGVRGALAELGLSANGFATYNVALEITFALSFTLIASVIFFRKRNNLPALFFSLMLLMFGVSSIPVLPTMYALELAQPALMPLTRLMTFLTWVTVFVFFCVFPDGRFVPRWSLWFAGGAILISVPWTLWPDTPLSPWMWPPPALIALELTLWGTLVYFQVYRYRQVSNSLQRQQTRWVVLGMAVSVICILAFFLPRIINPALARPSDRFSLQYYLLSATVIALSALFTPLAMGISILRYRLWAIDPILHRALVYIPLTGILAGIYTASITLFQRLFMAFTGDKSDGAIVMATLVLASMFTPVKNALQTVVDRRFKQPPNPTEKLEEFGEQVESVVQVFDASTIARRLLDEAVAAFDATGGAVYLRRRLARSVGSPHEHVTGAGPGPSSRWQQQSRWQGRSRRRPRPPESRYGHRPGREHREPREQDRPAWPPKPYRSWGIYADLELACKSEHWNGNTVIGVPLTLNGTRYGLLTLGQRQDGQAYTPNDREKLKTVVDSVTDALVMEALAANR